MAISKVISSQSSISNLRYLFNEQAHNTALTDHRNLACGGRNLTYIPLSEPTRIPIEKNTSVTDIDYGFLNSQFKVSRSKATNKNKKIQSYHYVVSFSKEEFDCSDIETQAQQAKTLMSKFFEQDLPDTAQYVFTVQADNDGGLLHVHTIINSVNKDGKVLNTKLLRQTGKGGLRDRLDSYLEENFQKVTQKPYERLKPKQNGDYFNAVEQQIRKRNGYVWKDDLKMRIRSSQDKATSLDEFERILSKNGVSVTTKRVGTGTDNNGKKTYRQGYTYSFVDTDGKQRKIRDYAITKNGGIRGLGLDFTRDNISKTLKVPQINVYKAPKQHKAEREQDVDQENYVANEKEMTAIVGPKFYNDRLRNKAFTWTSEDIEDIYEEIKERHIVLHHTEPQDIWVKAQVARVWLHGYKRDNGESANLDNYNNDSTRNSQSSKEPTFLDEFRKGMKEAHYDYLKFKRRKREYGVFGAMIGVFYDAVCRSIDERNREREQQRIAHEREIKTQERYAKTFDTMYNKRLAKEVGKEHHISGAVKKQFQGTDLERESHERALAEVMKSMKIDEKKRDMESKTLFSHNFYSQKNLPPAVVSSRVANDIRSLDLSRISMNTNLDSVKRTNQNKKRKARNLTNIAKKQTPQPHKHITRDNDGLSF